MAETTDYTPDDLDLTTYRRDFTVKRHILDRMVYPISTRLVFKMKASAHPELSNFSFKIDRILWGDRGSGFLASLMKRFITIRGADVLIQGCGLGYESFSWEKMHAGSCLGLDLFNFRRAWDGLSSRKSATKLSFEQGDICHTDFPSDRFDIISSSAVWEHVKEFDELMKESSRLVKPGGLVFASFGPLWYTYSGDHFSAKGGHENAYNHVLMERENYLNWIDSFERSDEFATSDDDYFEIRRHIHEGLFSYLRPSEYIEKVEKRFRRVHTAIVVNPAALEFKANYPDKWQEMLDKGLKEEDLITKSLRLILAPLDS